MSLNGEMITDSLHLAAKYKAFAIFFMNDTIGSNNSRHLYLESQIYAMIKKTPQVWLV